MFGSDRGDRPALIVLGLLVAALLVVSFVGLYARHEANYQVGCYAPTEVNESGQKQYEPVCPEDYLLFGDGAAQWVMALFAMVATGASLVGIVLLRRTFEETRNTALEAASANKLARESLAADQRPWLKLSNISAARIDWDPNGTLAVVASAIPFNFGKTPALRVEMHCELGTVPDDKEAALDEFCGKCTRTVTLGRSVAIFPQEERKPLIDTAAMDGFNIESAPRALFLTICVVYIGTGDSFDVFHTGAAVTLDLAIIKTPPPNSRTVFGNITVRDAGNIYSIR